MIKFPCEKKNKTLEYFSIYYYNHIIVKIKIEKGRKED